ncbi:MAG TPA: ThuA domain-containing protein [Verrucomicrobiae bacterium]|jgi:type 1 glutamine amidotransferase
MNRRFALQLLCALALLVVQSFAAEKPKRVLIVGQSPDGHPPTTHEFMAGARVLNELLKTYPDIQTTVVKADEPWPEGPKLLDQSDGLVMLVTQGSRWMQTDSNRWAAIKRLAARGGAIVALHWSVGSKDAEYIDGQLNLLGATRGGPQRKYVESLGNYHRVAPKHPILTGVPDFTAFDEHYYRLDRRDDIQPLLTVNIEGKDEMVAWAWERPGGGRSFGFVGLHFHANWQLPVYRRFVVQGVRWTLKLPIPEGGVNTDIDPKALELDGKLPPPGPLPAKKSAAAK